MNSTVDEILAVAQDDDAGIGDEETGENTPPPARLYPMYDSGRIGVSAPGGG
jgi:hypothetical protein